MMKTRVLVIDDSARCRAALAQMLELIKDVETAGFAADAVSGREMMKNRPADVLAIGTGILKSEGLEYLEGLLRIRRMPVLLVSAAEAGPDITLRALEVGAVDSVTIPNSDNRRVLEESAAEFSDKIRAASTVQIRARTTLHSPSSPALATSGHASPVIFVGASTGGTEALKVFLLGMPADCPPILVVQHMPETFTGSFARRLDTLCQPRVVEAGDREKVEPGVVYIAPGHSHLRIRRQGNGLVTELLQTLPVNRHRPSVDVLFESAAEVIGRQALGVILTGMGKDGAHGLLLMRHAGARTFGQDEASCVVYGMPREAYQIGAVEEQVRLDDMAKRVLAGAGRP